jgi:hypothetical protein
MTLSPGRYAVRTLGASMALTPRASDLALSALPPRRENRRCGERVHQAAREILSAILTPSTAAGGADGERCTGCPAAIAAAASVSSTRWHYPATGRVTDPLAA